jgi:hypothetical protein
MGMPIPIYISNCRDKFERFHRESGAEKGDFGGIPGKITSTPQLSAQYFASFAHFCANPIFLAWPTSCLAALLP